MTDEIEREVRRRSERTERSVARGWQLHEDGVRRRQEFVALMTARNVAPEQAFVVHTEVVAVGRRRGRELAVRFVPSLEGWAVASMPSGEYSQSHGSLALALRDGTIAWTTIYNTPAIGGYLNLDSNSLDRSLPVASLRGCPTTARFLLAGKISPLTEQDHNWGTDAGLAQLSTYASDYISGWRAVR